MFDLETEEAEPKAQRATLKVVLADSHEMTLDWDCDETGVSEAFTLMRQLSERLTRRYLDRANDWQTDEEQVDPGW